MVSDTQYEGIRCHGFFLYFQHTNSIYSHESDLIIPGYYSLRLWLLICSRILTVSYCPSDYEYVDISLKLTSLNLTLLIFQSIFFHSYSIKKWIPWTHYFLTEIQLPYNHLKHSQLKKILSKVFCISIHVTTFRCILCSRNTMFILKILQHFD